MNWRLGWKYVQIRSQQDAEVEGCVRILAAAGIGCFVVLTPNFFRLIFVNLLL